MSVWYQLKVPAKATWHKSRGVRVPATIPGGAKLHYFKRSPVLLGVVHVLWEGREYEIPESILQKHAERVQSV